ncbi:MAG: SAM-dependent methyltransferase [Bacteroidales bacterium]|nr:SAM-dependent methyltransferase [Bacteroidales bacterium]MBN2633333.1 SAM-dependent methyltransferase [Bacteroidales bacterium]
MQIEIIGYIRNGWDEAEPGSAELIKKEISEVEILDNYTDGLYKIENFPDLNIFFYFHRSDGYELQTTARSGDFRGVFSTCSPRRPSLIGMTSVRLVERKGNILRVTGLDAINGTPVLDIKPVIRITG